MADARTYSLHIQIFPAEDVPGQWLAHCLEFDVMSQGNDPQHAVSMIREAVGIVLLDDLAKGFDPTRRCAPREDWDEMWARLRRGRAQPLDEATRGTPDYIVFESLVTLTPVTLAELSAIGAGTAEPPPVTFTDPVAFARAA